MKNYKIKVLKEISRSLHPFGAYYQKNQKVISVVEDVEKLECLHTGNRNVKWCSYYEKQYGGPLNFFKELL